MLRSSLPSLGFYDALIVPQWPSGQTHCYEAGAQWGGLSKYINPIVPLSNLHCPFASQSLPSAEGFVCVPWMIYCTSRPHNDTSAICLHCFLLNEDSPDVRGLWIKTKLNL